MAGARLNGCRGAEQAVSRVGDRAKSLAIDQTVRIGDADGPAVGRPDASSMVSGALPLLCFQGSRLPPSTAGKPPVSRLAYSVITMSSALSSESTSGKENLVRFRVLSVGLIA